MNFVMLPGDQILTFDKTPLGDNSLISWCDISELCHWRRHWFGPIWLTHVYASDIPVTEKVKTVKVKKEVTKKVMKKVTKKVTKNVIKKVKKALKVKNVKNAKKVKKGKKGKKNKKGGYF